VTDDGDDGDGGDSGGGGDSDDGGGGSGDAGWSDPGADTDAGTETDRSAATVRATPADTRLYLDAMLGSLARLLRMCGYDAAYALDRGTEADCALRRAAHAEGRLLLTRDRDLAGRAGDALLLESKAVDDQLGELRGAGVALSLDEPAPCAVCNAALERVPESGSAPEYAPDPAARPVWRCPDCGQHFWRGSHWADVRERLAEL
jgi:uncharacterized protein with PIN domain